MKFCTEYPTLRSKTFTLLFALALTSSLALAKKPSGNGKPSSDPQVEFLFPVDEFGAPLITGDDPVGHSISDADCSDCISYKNSENDPGVNAYIMGSGNPRLELVNSIDRYLELRFGDQDAGSCEIDGTSLAGLTVYADIERLIFSQLANEEDWNSDTYSTIDGRFLGMNWDPDPELAYSMMGMLFTDTFNGEEYEWSPVFGDYEGHPEPQRDRVEVRRVREDLWHITSLDEGVSHSTAEIRLRKGKGKRAVELSTFCDFYLDFYIRLVP